MNADEMGRTALPDFLGTRPPHIHSHARPLHLYSLGRQSMPRKGRLLLLLAAVGWTAVLAFQDPPPQAHACSNPVVATLEGSDLPAFCDPTLSLDERIDDLVARLDVDEKVRVSFCTITCPPPPPSSLSSCHRHHQIALLVNTADAVPSQGLPAYQWWSDAQHGLAYAPGIQFVAPTPVATSFPQVRACVCERMDACAACVPVHVVRLCVRPAFAHEVCSHPMQPHR